MSCFADLVSTPSFVCRPAFRPLRGGGPVSARYSRDFIQGDDTPLSVSCPQIEREVILSGSDKDSKIPILHEYKKRPKSATAIAPDAPSRSLAWTEDKQAVSIPGGGASRRGVRPTGRECDVLVAPQALDTMGHVVYKAQPLHVTQDSPVSQPRPVSYHPGSTTAHESIYGRSGKTSAFPSRTYHSIKDLISSRFGSKGSKDGGDLESGTNATTLNNLPAAATHNGNGAPPQAAARYTGAAAEDGSSQPTRTPTTPRTRTAPGRKEDDYQHLPATALRHGGASSSYRQVEEDGAYGTTGAARVMRQPMYGQTKAPDGTPGGDSTYGHTKQGQAQAEQEAQTPKGVTYGGGLYQVVHDDHDPNEVYVDQDPYVRTPTAGVAASAATGQAEQSTAASTPAAPQVRRGSQSQPQGRPEDEDDDDEGGFVSDRARQSGHGGRGDVTAASQATGGPGSDYDKAGAGALDSGRGSTVYSSGTRSKASGASSQPCLDTSTEMAASPHGQTPGGHPCEWVDMVESELRQILDNSLGNTTGANSTLSESISSMTPPLPPLSPGGSSPGASPRASGRYGHSQSLPYGTKPDYSLMEFGGRKAVHAGLSASAKRVGGHAQVSGSARSWRQAGKQLSHKKKEQMQMSAKGGKIPLSALGLEDGAGLDLDSMLDGATNTEENNTSDDEDMSTTVDASDTRAIRKQLEGLEGMYSEVLKLLGVRKQRVQAARYQPSDPRVNKRRLYGSMSSLPSSVSSRPVRDLRDRRRHDDRKKVRDLEGINKRFQRLESHVVTLARSVAHLSSEMRTQHLMIREMEHIRSEMASLRTQTNMIAARSQSQSVPRGLNQLLADKDPRKDRLRDPAAITNPSRVKKLTKFFGDEPPLLRIFLKKLGYEKYAGAFEQERVGMVELPYLTEERLQKMGIPMGPRLRILQEAQISACRDTVYVV
ncbi:hypothetical protein ONE63_001714 [Megalurothrips usitatus]|uniref:SAM domain-containing protein n=1 Tax=Megalurothrips usitatus TaxID=439358 RepID=A0AAV7X9A3_9NEOP|nr:hypothetical protein ONE63_001714 [Megalurothrips usitatus]